jgi:hypothetical protein
MKEESDQQANRDQQDRQSLGSVCFCQVEQIVVRVMAFSMLLAEVWMDLARVGFQPARRETRLG